MSEIRVAAVDDDRMLLDGLDTWLSEVDDISLVGVASSVDELLAARLADVDVVLLDLMLRDGSDPVCNVRRLVTTGLRVLVVSVWARPRDVAAAYSAGAAGYLTKDNDLTTLTSAVRAVAAGEPPFSPELALACLRDPRPQRPRLSPREREILLAYASGMTLKTAARHLGIRPETAKTYLDRVKAKYADRGRPTYTKADLVNRVHEDGLA